MTTPPDAEHVAANAIYLYMGYATATRMKPLSPEEQERRSDMYNGEVGIMQQIAKLAVFATVAEESVYAQEQEFPGVWHYEVAEPMGYWINDNFDAHESRFIDEIGKRAKAWVEEGMKR